MRKVLITVLLEISDHDGYCSGEECEYESKQIVHLCDVPEEYENCEIGTLNKNDLSDEKWSQYWIDYLPEYNDFAVCAGSYYCDLSKDCENAELERHDSKYTILSVEIVDVI